MTCNEPIKSMSQDVFIALHSKIFHHGRAKLLTKKYSVFDLKETRYSVIKPTLNHRKKYPFFTVDRIMRFLRHRKTKTRSFPMVCSLGFLGGDFFRLETALKPFFSNYLRSRKQDPFLEIQGNFMVFQKKLLETAAYLISAMICSLEHRFVT